MNSLLELVRVLGKADRTRLVFLIVAITIAAVIDAAGIASIVPFLALITRSDSSSNTSLLVHLRDMVGVADQNTFVILVGLLSFSIIVLASVLNAYVMWAQVRFSYRTGFLLSQRLLRAYLANDQLALLERNSAEMGKNILSEVDRLVTSALLPIITLVSRITVAVCIVAFLLFIEPMLAFVLAVVFGGVYVAIYLFTRRRLQSIGEAAMQSNQARFQSISEVFAALRELRIYGRVAEFIKRFDAPALVFANANATAIVMSQFPKFVLEPLAFGSVIFIVFYQMRSGGNIESAMPVIGLFAFAGYRLMPAFQSIFLAFSTVRFYMPTLRLVLKDLNSQPEQKRSNDAISPLRFTDKLVMRGVGFSYGNGVDVLKDINLTIPAHATIGLIGRTGSGKTTLVSLILGLLSPTSGRIEVDGGPLAGLPLTSWQRQIGYVPQDVFLTDETVLKNIALGIPAEDVDRAAAEAAARLADIHDFIIGLPDGYETSVGERGARLSGGQRQRIGIARALYHDPAVVVFDEATSGLDRGTEEAVMAAIGRLAGDRTLIIIAHRPGALRRAQVVHLLDGGRIAASGTLKELQPLLNLEDEVPDPVG